MKLFYNAGGKLLAGTEVRTAFLIPRLSLKEELKRLAGKGKIHRPNRTESLLGNVKKKVKESKG